MAIDTKTSVFVNALSGAQMVFVAFVVAAIAVLSMPNLAQADGGASLPDYDYSFNFVDDYGYDYSYNYADDYGYDYSYNYVDEWYQSNYWNSYEEYNDYYSYESDYYWNDYYYEPYYVDYSYDSCSYGCYDYPDYGCNSGCYQPEPEPVCTQFEASDETIEEGDSVTLSWKTRYADSVYLSGYGSVSANGSRTVSPNNDTTYTLKVSGHGGTDTCTVHVEVKEEKENDLWCKLDVSDNRVEEGDEVTLEWDARGATYASINQGVGRVDEDGGEEDVEVDDDTTYRLTVRDRDGDEETCSASVRVDNEDDFSSISFNGDPVNNPPTVYLSQLPYTGIEDMSPSLIASLVMLAGLLGIGGYFFFVKRRTV